MPRRARHRVDVPDAIARPGALRAAVDAARDALDVGELALAGDVLRELDHRLLALADRAGGDGRAANEHELPRPRRMLSSDEDRASGKVRVDGADQIVDVRPLLGEHDGDADRVGLRIYPLENFGDRQPVTNQVRLRRGSALERRLTEGVDDVDAVAGVQQRAGDVRRPDRQYHPDRIGEAGRDGGRSHDRDVRRRRCALVYSPRRGERRPPAMARGLRRIHGRTRASTASVRRSTEFPTDGAPR